MKSRHRKKPKWLRKGWYDMRSVPLVKLTDKVIKDHTVAVVPKGGGRLAIP
jgi:hypothetical protein